MSEQNKNSELLNNTKTDNQVEGKNYSYNLINEEKKKNESAKVEKGSWIRTLTRNVKITNFR